MASPEGYLKYFGGEDVYTFRRVGEAINPERDR